MSQRELTLTCGQADFYFFLSMHAFTQYQPQSSAHACYQRTRVTVVASGFKSLLAFTPVCEWLWYFTSKYKPLVFQPLQIHLFC